MDKPSAAYDYADIPEATDHLSPSEWVREFGHPWAQHGYRLSGEVDRLTQNRDRRVTKLTQDRLSGLGEYAVRTDRSQTADTHDVYSRSRIALQTELNTIKASCANDMSWTAREIVVRVDELAEGMARLDQAATSFGGPLEDMTNYVGTLTYVLHATMKDIAKTMERVRPYHSPRTASVLSALPLWLESVRSFAASVPLDELENKASPESDWRNHYRQHARNILAPGVQDISNYLVSLQSDRVLDQSTHGEFLQNQYNTARALSCQVIVWAASTAIRGRELRDAGEEAETSGRIATQAGSSTQ